MTTPYPIDAPHPGRLRALARPPGARRSTTLWVGLGVAVLVSLTGLPLGLLWGKLAQQVPALQSEISRAYASAEPERAVAADGLFVMLGGATGLLVAVLAWVLLRRYRGVTILVALTAGSLVAAYAAWLIGRATLLAAYVAWVVGLFIGQVDVQQFLGAPTGALPAPPLPLAGGLNTLTLSWPWQTGVTAVQPLLAAVTYTTLAAFSAYPGLRPVRRPVPPPPHHDGLTPDAAPPAPNPDPDEPTR